MTTIYEIGGDRLWTGAMQEIGEAEGIGGGWTRSAPPDVGAGEHARWNGAGWSIVSSGELLAEMKATKLAALAARRWQAETGGIVVGGLSVKTDEDTQRKITGAYVQALQNPSFTVKWKIATGVFVTLDDATILVIGDAVTAHIQSCFDKEADLTADILAAADEAALDALDIESGWPG